MIYFTLFYEFFKIGLFSVGGGMATLPFLMDLTYKYDWFSASELANMVAISESTPGPVGVNMATYAGYSAAGLPGALVATLSLTAPAIVIISIIAKFLTDFSDNKNVKACFYGFRAVVPALIGVAVLELVKIAIIKIDHGIVSYEIPGIIIGILVLILLQFKPLKKLHPIVWIIIGAILGIILNL